MFNDLFNRVDINAPSVTFCVRLDGETVTVMAYKEQDKPWINCDSPQPTGANREFYVALDTYGFSMSTYPVSVSGYSYQTYVNLNADEPLLISNGEISRLLKIMATDHDRTFYVAPDENMTILLTHIPTDCQIATVIMTIEFKERRYTVTGWRCSTGAGLETFVVDPPAFESALRLAGWRQNAPPSHQKFNNYHVMIERNNDGARYVITDRTDLQHYRTTEEGLVNHFKLAHA